MMNQRIKDELRPKTTFRKLVNKIIKLIFRVWNIICYPLFNNKLYKEFDYLNLESSQNQKFIEMQILNKKIAVILDDNHKDLENGCFLNFCQDLLNFKNDYEIQKKSEFWRRSVLNNPKIKENLMKIFQNFEKYQNLTSLLKEIFFVYPGNFILKEKRMISKKLDYLNLKKINSLNEFTIFLESEGLEYLNKKKNFKNIFLNFLNQSSKYENRLLSLLLIMFCDYENLKIKLDEKRINKLIIFLKLYLDFRNSISTTLKKQAFLFYILFTVKNIEKINFEIASF